MKASDYFALAGLLLVAGMFCCILYYAFVYIFVRPVINFIRLRRPLDSSHIKILEDKFPYYNALEPKERKDFHYRLRYFMSVKGFYGKHKLGINDEMMIMVGASAVQITFGFQPLQLPTFNKVLLFPRDYYSSRTGRRHKGEVNAGGMILFSWEDFLHGYKISNDGLNLGLHEMAHALKIENTTQNSEYAFLDSRILSQWDELTEMEIQRIKEGKNTFLRPYAATNHEEFFAVCVEQFFERPEEFYKAHPELYDTLSALLNQDLIDREKLF